MNEINNSLVSVAIPAYKKQYLKDAIDSVLVQSHSNFELIIVNDCSPEDLDEIINQYNDTRIRYYKNKVNLGKESIVHNWNKCLSYARGEFFVLLCDDDIIYPNFITELVELTYKYPTCQVFKSRTITRYPNNVVESPLVPEYESFESFIYNKIFGNRKHTISEFLYRTEYVKKIKYSIYPIGFYADDSSILSFIKEYGIVSSNKILVEFRYSDINISFNSKLNYKKTIAAIQYYDFIIQNYLDESQIKRIREIRDCDIYDYYIHTKSPYTSLKILLAVPHRIWNIRQKVALLFKRFFL